VTIVEGAGAALLRGACVTLLSVAAGLLLRPLMLKVSGRARAAAWVLLLSPYLIPTILVGYAYAPLALRAQAATLRDILPPFLVSIIPDAGAPPAGGLLGASLWEFLYAGLLLLRFVPLVTLVLCIAPRSCSTEAALCHRLLAPKWSLPKRAAAAVTFWLSGEGRSVVVAFAVVFLFAFADFELATLLNASNASTWTITLFDAQKGGVPVGQTLGLALAPLLCEIALLILIVVMLTRSRGAAAIFPPPSREAGPIWRQAGLWTWLFLAAGVMVVAPAAVVLGGAVKGFSLAMTDRVIAKDITAGLLFAGATALCAYLIAGARVSPGEPTDPAQPGSRALGRLAALAISIPGLFGGLVLGLVVQFLFLRHALNWAYDTPIPIVIALVALILPFALLLRILLRAFRQGEALHSATLLRVSPQSGVRRAAARLVWRLKTRRHFWAAFLLFYLAYFELTASAILAPTGMTPVVVRLYNQMHYGQMAALSAMVSIAFAAPFVVALAVFAAMRYVFLAKRAV